MTLEDQQPTEGSRLPVIGFVLAFLIGPLGSAIGIWQAARARREQRPVPRLAVAAIVIGLIQTAVVLGVYTGLSRHDAGGEPGASTPTASYPDWETVTPEPEEPGEDQFTPAPDRPLPTSLGEFSREQVGGFTASSTTPHTETIEQGATGANEATYTDSKHSVDVVTAQWADADAAKAHVQARAAERFNEEPARVSSDIPNGTMWYWMQDGQGYLYAFQGPFSIIVTGDQNSVQQFFSQFG